jgi:Skp family chaperone for outer membrane proteins
MKNLILFSAMLLLCTGMFAQKATEGTEKSPLGTDGKCLVIDLEAQGKNVEAVLNEKFKKLKGKKEKGFEAYKAQIFSEVSSNTLDYYWKVDTKGDNKTKVLFFMSTGYDNWLNPNDHASEINNAKKMLDALITEVRTYELNLAIDAQTKVLESAVKEQEKLVKENESLKSDLDKLQKEIEENKKATETNVKTQETQKKVVEDQKKVLDELQKQLGQVK